MSKINEKNKKFIDNLRKEFGIKENPESLEESKPWHLCVEHRKKIVEIWQCQIQWMWEKLLINQIIVEKLQV